VTRTPLSRSKGQRSRSPGRFTHRRVGASGSCSGGRGNVLAVRNCCYVAVCSASRGASAPTGRGRRGAEAYRGGRPLTACYRLLRRSSTVHSSSVPVSFFRVCRVREASQLMVSRTNRIRRRKRKRFVCQVILGRNLPGFLSVLLSHCFHSVFRRC